MGGAPNKEKDKRAKSSMEEHMNRGADAAKAASEAVPKAFFGQTKARKAYSCSYCGLTGTREAVGIGWGGRIGHW